MSFRFKQFQKPCITNICLSDFRIGQYFKAKKKIMETKVVSQQATFSFSKKYCKRVIRREHYEYQPIKLQRGIPYSMRQYLYANYFRFRNDTNDLNANEIRCYQDHICAWKESNTSGQGYVSKKINLKNAQTTFCLRSIIKGIANVPTPTTLAGGENSRITMWCPHALPTAKQSQENETPDK